MYVASPVPEYGYVCDQVQDHLLLEYLELVEVRKYSTMSKVQLQTAVSAVDLMLTFNHISRPRDHQSHAHVQSLWGQSSSHQLLDL